MTEPLARLASALADRYRIERELGHGGMATVYLAQDLKHDRKVAVKVLKPELAAVLGAERFVVEIKTTAALQHPHILPLFDSGTAEGFLFYVMPFIEGETLRDKLNRETQLGIDEAVRIATEVADALDYAHRHGVNHRDIKTENIILHDGRPMVADFGIALAVSAAAGGRMTETGLSLGTPHYMSPEQATAEKEITGRSDVYSLASVLYEMLTGEPPHMGKSAQQIIMKIIADTPRPVTELRKSVPQYLADAIAQALEKLPADRFSTAADFAAAINGRLAPRSTTAARNADRAGTAWRRRETIIAGVAVVALAVAGWTVTSGRSGTSSRERVEFAFRMGIGVPDRPYIAISPDGRRILEVVLDSNPAGMLAEREIGSTAVRIIPGTVGAQDPFYSFDGEWIAFILEGELRKMRSTGGASTKLADTISTGGGSWSSDGSLVFSGQYDGLFRGSSNGGRAERLTTLDTARLEFGHWYPQQLPGGKSAIFNSFSTPLSKSRIEAVEYATGRRTVLAERAVYARYAPSGHLLFMRDGVIFAVAFDARSLKVTGPEVPVVEDVAWTPTDGVAGFAVSPTGTLVYLKASDWSVNRRLVWVDRAGKERPVFPDSGVWAEPRLSPDGRWIAVTRMEPSRQLWLYDRTRGLLTQLTRGEAVTFNGVWTPNSRALVATTETPVYDLVRIPIDGSGVDTLRKGPNDKFATAVSPDGRTLIFMESLRRERLMLAPMSGGDARPIEVRETAQRNATFSPDGRWIAYEELGADAEPEIYVRAVDGRGGRRQISAGGGSEPRWTKGGREIVYRNHDAVLAAPFQPGTGEAGTPVMLFRKMDSGRLGARRTSGYDVTPDGSEFLMVIANERRDALPTVVVINWIEELKAKVPR